jgi:hypothetical protein
MITLPSIFRSRSRFRKFLLVVGIIIFICIMAEVFIFSKYTLGMTEREVKKVLSDDHVRIAFAVDFWDGVPSEEELEKVEVFKIIDVPRSVELYFNSKNKVVKIRRIGVLGVNLYNAGRLIYSLKRASMGSHLNN